MLLVTSTPIYDRTATVAIFEPQQLSASHSQCIEKMATGEHSFAEVLLNATEVQMDQLLANQHTIMANQDLRMDKIEHILL